VTSQPTSIRRGDTIENPVTGETIHFLRTTADTDGELVEIEVTVEPDGAVAAAHVHPFQSERFEVLEGTLEFRRGRRKVVAGAGEVVTVEAGTAHSFRNVGETTARFRCEVRPRSSSSASSRRCSASLPTARRTARGCRARCVSR
jgi:mannose-6-phosphate isomerase-like protein (cupin superfamily)